MPETEPPKPPPARGTVRVIAERELTPEEAVLAGALARLRARYPDPAVPAALKSVTDGQAIEAAIGRVLPLVRERELAQRSDLDSLPPKLARTLLAETSADLRQDLRMPSGKKVRRLARFIWSRALHRRARPTRIDPAGVLILALAIESIAGRRFGYRHAHTRPGKETRLSEPERSGPAEGEMLDVLLAAYAVAQARARLLYVPEVLRPLQPPKAEGVLDIIKKARQSTFCKAAEEAGIDLGDPGSIFVRGNDLALLLGQDSPGRS